MKITIREFIHSLLLGARMLDECRTYLKTEEIVWASWGFDDCGAHYLHIPERGMNPGTMKFELLKRVDPLMSWTPEGMHS